MSFAYRSHYRLGLLVDRSKIWSILVAMMKSFSCSPFIFFAFGPSEFTDLLDKGPCFAKVAEPEGPLDTMSVVAEFPVRGLRTEAFGFLMSEWWDAATAGRACFSARVSVM